MSREPTFVRFDSIPAWLNLDPKVQGVLGVLVLEYALACFLTDEADPIRARAGLAAEERIRNELVKCAQEVIRPQISGTPTLPLPSMLGMVCQDCGCSEKDACPGGCSWADTDLCSRCAEVRQEAAAAAADLERTRAIAIEAEPRLEGFTPEQLDQVEHFIRRGRSAQEAIDQVIAEQEAAEDEEHERNKRECFPGWGWGGGQ